MAKIIEEVKEIKEAKKFKVTSKVKFEGYVADIDGLKFAVTPQLMGQTIDPLTNNRGYGVLSHSICSIYDLSKVERVDGNVYPAKIFEATGYFEGLNKEQERQLLIAGVIE